MEKQWEDTRDQRMSSWNNFMKKVAFCLCLLSTQSVCQGRKRRRDFKPMPDQIETRNGKESEALDKHFNDEVLHTP